MKVEIDLWSLCVWAYQRQCVVQETGRYLEDIEAAAEDQRLGFARDSIAAALRIAELGCHVDGGPGGPGASRCHPDAEILHACVLSLPHRHARVLIDAATIADKPERCAITPSWRRCGHAGTWERCAIPPDLPANRAAVLFLNRRCRRHEGFHFEIGEETALVWSPYTVVEEYPVTTEYARLVDAVAATFEEAMDRLRCVVEGVAFQAHTVTCPAGGASAGPYRKLDQGHARQEETAALPLFSY
jgi:hypothetical protein